MKNNNKKPTIMFVTPYFPPNVGGVQNYVYNIVKGLNKIYGWNIVVITTHNQKKMSIEQKDGIKIYRLPYLFKISNTPIHPLWYFTIKNIIRKEKPDLINAHTPVPFMADITAHLTNTIPFILHYHNDITKDNILKEMPYTLFYILVGKYTLKKTKKIVVTSEFYANNSKKLQPYLAKISSIPPGVNLDIHNPQVKPFPALAKNTKNILFVSRLDKTDTHKGLNYLLEAVAIITKKMPFVHLYVVGDGANKKIYERKAVQLGISNHVTFVGYATESDLSLYYASAEFLVLPSSNESEGFGMVFIEANAHKKPVIGTRVGGIPFAIDDKKSGFIIPPSDAAILADTMSILLKNTRLAKKMGEYGYQRVKKNFSWEAQIKKTYTLFSRLI